MNSKSNVAGSNGDDSVPLTRFAIFAGVILIVSLLTTAYLWAMPGLTESVLGGISLLLFCILTIWVTLGFCIALSGIKPMSLALASRRDEGGEPSEPERVTVASCDEEITSQRIALLVPIYNEDPAAVMACVQATAESLRRTGQGNRFDFFILSDTTNPDLWIQEELLWSRVRAEMQSDQPAIHYRHRANNVGRKSGNIGDFLTRWGLDYQYFVILDADSTMEGRTLVELATRMDGNKRLGILQAPPIPEGNHSLWARSQQFSARAYGPLFNFGLNAFCGPDGNYWGHNAMIRTQAFLRHCGLSILPGPEPLGGEVLSHDFVEAALMRRAGYQVRLAADLDGGYEQCPTTLEDHARRDQRWCQGNLQHLKIAVAPAWHPMSRLHLMCGAMSYLASPFWMLFLIVGAAIYITQSLSIGPVLATSVFASIMAMLFIPKWIAVAIMCRHRPTNWGGRGRIIKSMMLECVLSILVAPIMMLYHSRFVLLTLLGTKVRWNAQNRTANGLRFRDAFSSHGYQMLVGVLTTIAIAWYAAGLWPWTLPLVAGLVLAVPLAIAFASPTIGNWLATSGWLSTPEERNQPRLLRRRDVLQSTYAAVCSPTTNPSGWFGRLVQDPALYRLHQSLLAASTPPPDHLGNESRPASIRTIRVARKLIREGKVESIPRNMHRALLGDASALKKLHHEFWATQDAA